MSKNYISSRKRINTKNVVGGFKQRGVVLNRTEIRVFASSRSGHHPIIFWILRHTNPPLLYINDLYRRPKAGIPISFFSKGIKEEEMEIEKTFNTGDNPEKLTKKNLLIMNFEEPTWPTTPKKIDSWKGVWTRGESSKVINVIIMRDPFNHLASRIKMKTWSLKVSLEDWFKLYIDLSKEYLRITKYLQDPFVPINYNLWVESSKYRFETGKRLGLVGGFGERFQYVPHAGNGSSFDGMKFQHKAEQMKVLDRWRELKGHKQMKKLIKQKELLDLARTIFKESELNINECTEEVQT